MGKANSMFGPIMHMFAVCDKPLNLGSSRKTYGVVRYPLGSFESLLDHK